MRNLLALVLVVGLLPALAAAEHRLGLQIGAGYSHLDSDAEQELLDSGDSLYGNFSLIGGPFEDPGVRWGVGLVTSGYRQTDDIDGIPIDDDYDQEFGELYLWFIEARAGWYQPIGDYFFIEPSVGVGVVIGQARLGQEDDDYTDGEYTERDTSAGFGVRPAIAGGVRWNEHFMLGLETSYMWTNIEFDEGMGENISEIRLGVFFRYVF